MTHRAPISPAHRDAVDELLSATFNSIVSIEERMPDSKFTRDLTLTELHTICAVGMYDETPMNVIASRLNVTTATVTGTVNRLVRKGFVERTRSKEDRRVVLVRLTKNGRGAMRVHNLFHHKMVENVLEGMTPAEEDTFIQAVQRLKLFFEQERLYQAGAPSGVAEAEDVAAAAGVAETEDVAAAAGAAGSPDAVGVAGTGNATDVGNTAGAGSAVKIADAPTAASPARDDVAGDDVKELEAAGVAV
jgi:DNA-binding MarR family transcriptional regulator